MSGMGFSGSARSMGEYRNLDWDTDTDAGVDPIVINTWYTAFETTRNVKAWYLIFEQTNNGASAESIEIEITIDGTVFTTGSINTASGSAMYVNLNADGDLGRSTTVRQLLSRDDDQSAPLETRSLSIRVRQTTAVDVVSAILEVNMVYQTLEGI